MIGRPRRYTLAGGLVAASLIACIRGTLPPLELYRLLPADSASIARRLGSVGGAPALEGTLAIEPYATPGLYGEPQIVYRLGETRYGTYPSREWALPLSSMLATRTAETLRAASFASGSVMTELSRRGAHEFVWRGEVRQFEEVNRNRQVLAAVHLDASVVRAGGDSVLWRGSARFERRVDPPTMNAIVHTLSALADSAIIELAQQAGRTLRTGASAAESRSSLPR